MEIIAPRPIPIASNLNSIKTIEIPIGVNETSQVNSLGLKYSIWYRSSMPVRAASNKYLSNIRFSIECLGYNHPTFSFFRIVFNKPWVIEQRISSSYPLSERLERRALEADFYSDSKQISQRSHLAAKLYSKLTHKTHNTPINCNWRFDCFESE